MSHGEVGYKRPPVKNRFRKGQSGNPQGGWKGQRNLPAVLTEVLHQTVSLNRATNPNVCPRARPSIKMLMSMAHQGDRRAINAMINLTEKIGRIDNTQSESGAHKYGFMLVPGVATSKEEWQRECAKRPQTPAYGKAPAASPPRRIVSQNSAESSKQNVPTPRVGERNRGTSLPIEIVPAGPDV